MTAGSQPLKRGTLSREQIVAAGVELADDVGIDAITMRSVAKAVGCEVMSLYNHIESKADLIAAMGDQVAAEPCCPPIGTGSWKAAVREHAIDLYRTMDRHPWVAIVWVTTHAGPERLAMSEWLLGTIEAADLDPRSADHAFHAITDHAIGSALQKAMIGSDAQRSTNADLTEQVAYTGDFPLVTAHIESHRRGEQGPSFEFVLDIILDAFP